jgi:RimJ/RimL family protein N-acetyltransferase
MTIAAAFHPPIPVIETARLRLRGPEARDLPAYTAFYATDRSRWVGGPLDAREAWRGFAAMIGHWHLLGFGFFTVTRHGDDRAVGRVGCLFPAAWPEREIGWTMYEGEGEGLAFEAAQAVRDFAFRQLGWPTAVSYIAPDNTRSRQLAQRLGCVLDLEAAPLPFAEVEVWRHPAPEARP